MYVIAKPDGKKGIGYFSSLFFPHWESTADLNYIPSDAKKFPSKKEAEKIRGQFGGIIRKIK